MKPNPKYCAMRSRQTGFWRTARNISWCLTALLVSSIARGAYWQAELEDGRQIQVDPQTNRAVIQSAGGAATPLWDGVHRLSDGSVITVRSGLMVPNADVMALRRGEPAETAPPSSGTACDDLMLQACGLNDECAAAEPCDLARQLRILRRAPASTDSDQREWAELRCQQSLADPQLFPACAAAQSVAGAPCEELVTRVCGEAQRCAASEACQLAHQLLDFEKLADAGGRKDDLRDARRQCQQTLGQHAVFPPCR